MQDEARLAAWLNDMCMAHALGELTLLNEVDLRAVQFIGGIGQDPLERPPAPGVVSSVKSLARELTGRKFTVPQPASWADLAQLAREAIINAPGHLGVPGSWLGADGLGYFERQHLQRHA